MDFKALGSNLMSSFNEGKFIEHFNRQQLKESLGSEIDISSTSIVTRNIARQPSSSITRQQSLEIHIDSVLLSDVALKILNGKYRKCLGIRVCWHFLNFESTTPIIQVRQNVVRIADMQKYNITLNDVFLNHISNQKIYFDVYGAFDAKEKLLGRSEMDMKDLLNCTQKEVPLRLEILSLKKFHFFKRCQNINNKMGVLTMKYCLKPLSLTELPKVLNRMELEELFYKLHRAVSSELLKDSNSVCVLPCEGKSPSSIHEAKAKKMGISVSDYGFIYNLLNNIIDGDEFSPIKEEPHMRMLKRRINYEKTLEEYAILSGTKPENVAVFMSDDVKIRNYDKRFSYESAVIINVMSLKLSEKKYPLKEDEIHEFYVEYQFLSRSGKDMESLSLPLLENRMIEYNFKRTFLIDNNRNHYDCKMLAKWIRDKKAIRFVVVEEPIEDVNRFQICKEIGFAEVYLFDLIQTEENVITDLYPIMDANNLNVHIGHLKVSIWGVQAMRNTALRVLAPYANKLQKYGNNATTVAT